MNLPRSRSTSWASGSDSPLRKRHGIPNELQSFVAGQRVKETHERAYAQLSPEVQPRI
jgi:hypothetical protein